MIEITWWLKFVEEVLSKLHLDASESAKTFFWDVTKVNILLKSVLLYRKSSNSRSKTPVKGPKS
jgi:hypothetical protein